MVSLSEDQYTKHIIAEGGHTEVPPNDIQRAIETPRVIYQSSYYPDRDVYFSRTSSVYPAHYVKVAVKIDEDAQTGDVITAFITKEVKGSIDTKGGPKYIEINNKL